MMLSGPLSILMGAAGIAPDSLFSATRYAYRFDLAAWGWIHFVIGVALVIAGLGPADPVCADEGPYRDQRRSVNPTGWNVICNRWTRRRTDLRLPQQDVAEACGDRGPDH